MVLQDSPPNSASSILHQFIISDSISGQTQFENQHFDAYRNELRLIADESPINQRRHLMDLLGASNEANQQAQKALPFSQFRYASREACNPRVERVSDEYSFVGSSPFASASTPMNQPCSASYGTTESFAIFIGNSRYLKPAQLLLEEVVNIGGKAMDLRNEKYIRRLSRNSRRGSLGLCSELKAELCNNGLSGEKHELQVKIVKLISLLEEVERRYEQYYPAFRRSAMSRHFCGLRDGITSQIIDVRRKISQDMPKINTGLSQLSLFDKESRHNRLSLQQLGIMQSQRQAWRPIRGLPETSVAILRSWLFEHFLHPYPNDSEKLMLASQTGLTKNQVSNWFINARVRLWKPMIEEMYKEEFADDSADSDPLLGSSSLPGEGDD
ncbi:BEL1-like homeodomain 11 [Actinidia rufa]|uniref:BEL1-like homeodomain 11 n=1 Tax=Actinidia rufa TaxID=165716 RepID=A0A7J0E0A9_9ERIC|nr:BEL1-like homeodomain 11 [Actinidia rufa]